MCSGTYIGTGVYVDENSECVAYGDAGTMVDGRCEAVACWGVKGTAVTALW